ncbi:MAG: hypothetical protein JOZ69_01885 [Myxococcales bacterium]|nr:hypothetical protein [Myxococcales bacterium]
MSGRDEDAGLGTSRVLDRDEVQGVLSGSFYAPEEPPSERSGKSAAGPKPTHYKVICISLYTRDLERLDGLVDALKARGITKANRSALIRVALDQVDLEKVPRGL